MACAAAGLITVLKSGADRISSARAVLSTSWLTDAFSDAASTPIAATRLSPIISADAVDAVRFGFRMALPRAIWPVVPPNRTNGAPVHFDAGRAKSGNIDV